MVGNTVYFGTEIKVNVSIDPMDDLTMDSYDFDCEFYCSSNRKIVLRKMELIRFDDSNYIAVIDTKALSLGSLKCKITAYIPDSDCDDGLRTEIIVLDTGIKIIRS